MPGLLYRTHRKSQKRRANGKLEQFVRVGGTNGWALGPVRKYKKPFRRCPGNIRREKYSKGKSFGRHRESGCGESPKGKESILQQILPESPKQETNLLRSQVW